VRVSSVERIQVGNTAKYSASIVPNEQIDLMFKSGGYVASIMQVRGADGRRRSLDVGDHVKQGMVMARIRSGEYQDRISQAKADLAKANAAYEQAKLNFHRVEILLANGSATKPEYDQAKAQLDTAVAGVDAGKAQHSLAKTQLYDSILRAPRDGWIAKRNIDVGSLVGPATPAFSLVDTHLVRVVFGVPDTAIGFVRLGRSIRVTTEAVGGELEGRVTSISPTADPRSRVYSVEVTLVNVSEKLKSGMIASLMLSEAHPHEVTVVPLAAVLRSPHNANGFIVMVADSSRDTLVAQSREVQLGDAYGNSISVTSGLQVGERVITTGASLVHDGDRIELLP
jgi:RND family efflux transporter MFP subunit